MIDADAGGYLVAFALSCFTVWTVLRCSEQVTPPRLITAGISLGLIFHAQPFWFAGTAVFLAAVMVGTRHYRSAIVCGVVALATIIVGRLAKGCAAGRSIRVRHRFRSHGRRPS